MIDSNLIGLVAVTLIFAIPLIAILGNFLLKMQKHRYLSQQAPTDEQLQALNQQAISLGDRVGTLEAILDAEMPQWRKKYDSPI